MPVPGRTFRPSFHFYAVFSMAAHCHDDVCVSCNTADRCPAALLIPELRHTLVRVLDTISIDI